MSTGRGNRRRDANASDAIAAILHPHEGYREKLQRKGVTPKDFERENKLRVKKLQAENRERRRREVRTRLENCCCKKRRFTRWLLVVTIALLRSLLVQEASQPGEFKLTRFKAVRPRVFRQEEVSTRSHTKTERVDYVNANAWEVIKAPSTRSNQEEEARPSRRDYGRIPRYLLERKEQWAREEEERRLNAPDPDCPPGMVLLDEDERIRTLRVLHKSLGEAQLRMNALPLSIETMMQIRRKNALEAKLQEIEDAIKVFDRAKVYVAAPLTDTSEKGRERTGSVAA
ncbi:hypothetical protein BBJ28_00023402 [Nothophytophthora sp. Chile5]|nr:hypothetical protein BBJ28_00023402 [Nothophytophthora sp. Chile5]